MKIVSMSGSLRENVGKKDAKALRRQDRVPCVMYGKTEQVLFSVPQVEFKPLVFSPDAAYIELTINGEKRMAMLKDIEYHPVTDNIMHADFYELSDDKPIVMSIPVYLTGTSVGVMKGGKAVLKIPEGLIDGFKFIIHGFDAMDDNRRKEYMLQPGYRKKVLKNLRVAATYGLAGYTHALLVPVVWFGRKLSKEKNKRIRNEFARELDTEIKVCEAKIEDATADGNQKQKYQLIRLRDELARQKERVTTNGKYI